MESSPVGRVKFYEILDARQEARKDLLSFRGEAVLKFDDTVLVGRAREVLGIRGTEGILFTVAGSVARAKSA